MVRVQGLGFRMVTLPAQMLAPVLTEEFGRPTERVPGHVCRVSRTGKFCAGVTPFLQRAAIVLARLGRLQ